MRVIAGVARSMPLCTPRGMDTRPTTDKIKETLFNMLQTYIPDCVFVDMFSGSGGIGIEALSRGAKHAYFVDNDTASNKCINENLKFTKLDDKATVLKQDAFTAMNLIHEKQVDVIFADPPYDAGYEEAIVRTLKGCSYVTDETLIIIEARLETEFDFVDSLGFEIIKEKCYKSNKHVWIMRKVG